MATPYFGDFIDTPARRLLMSSIAALAERAPRIVTRGRFTYGQAQFGFVATQLSALPHEDNYADEIQNPVTLAIDWGDAVTP